MIHEVRDLSHPLPAPVPPVGARPAPGPSTGTVITEMYDGLRTAVEQALAEHGALTLHDLYRAVAGRMGGPVGRTMPWHLLSVRFDLEHQGVIERLPDVDPPRLRLAS